MSPQNTEQFRQLADQFIQLANEQYQMTGEGRVGYALMYAAARFNAFLVASTAGHKSQLAAELEETTQYFTRQYQKMFTENISDYLQHYDEYL